MDRPASPTTDPPSPSTVSRRRHRRSGAAGWSRGGLTALDPLPKDDDALHPLPKDDDALDPQLKDGGGLDLLQGGATALDLRREDLANVEEGHAVPWPWR